MSDETALTADTENVNRNNFKPVDTLDDLKNALKMINQFQLGW